MADPSADYINAVFDQLKLAVGQQNGAAARAILEQVHADGHAELARRITTDLIHVGVNRLLATA